MIPFDLDDIIELTNSSSFEKGEDYYDSGCVKKIIKTGDKFKGTVTGTSVYNVTLDISDDKPEFHCSCPYDFGGICKHSVAFAMAVLNGEYDEKPAPAAAKKIINPDEFKEHFKNTDTQKKLNFLKQLLNKDTDLQNQFIIFAQGKPESTDNLTFVNIDEIRKTINDELSSIDFDDIVENYDSYNGGYYNDEGYIDEAYDEVETVFSPYFARATEFFKKGNLTDGTRIVMGMYEGIQNLPELENNEYDIFADSYNNEVLGIFKEKFNETLKVIEQTVKSDEMVFQVFNLVFQRFDLFENQKTSADSSAVHYDMKVFEKLFISLLINKETADYLCTLIQKNDLECLSMAFVLLKIAGITGNEQLWLNTAESFVEFEPEISRQLLDKYKIKNELTDFNRISELAFSKWPDKFSHYLIENLDKESEKTLYVKALKHYTSHNQSAKHYKVLREYLNEEQRKEFVDKTENRYNDLFYIQLLEIEKRFADILAYAQKKQDMFYDYDKVLTPIANIYPEDCFEIIKNKCNNALKSYDKNRKTYERMARWLKVMAQIESKQKEAREYIESLYNHKPNLPALKDEIRKAKLIT